MESHPIPQQISSYQFKLVGDMTLKQFFQLAGGVLVSFLIYSTGLHPIIKWPLIFISVGIGVALAFLPFEERPLSSWFSAFFRSIYSPTIYIWKKTEVAPAFFMPEPTTNAIQPAPTNANKFLQTLPQNKEVSPAKLDTEEDNFLQQITGLFSQLGGNTPSVQPAVPTTPPANAFHTTTQAPPAVHAPAPRLMTQIPENKPVSFGAPRGFRPKIVIEEKIPENEQNKAFEVKTGSVTPVLAESQSAGSVQAQFAPEVAPPNPPSIPNTISGQVFDLEGKILESAILEIRDIAGRPVRALRSNKLGHFLIVTALENGHYEIITDKEGYIFDPISFEAKGDIIPPIVIRSKTKSEPSNNYAGKPLVIN